MSTPIHPDPNPAGFEPAASPVSERYARVALGKFVVMHLATLGLYSLVWFYRMWRAIKRDDDSRIIPLLRTVFGPLFYFGLISDLRKNSGADLSFALPVLYLMLSGLAWRLPDPYWLVTWLAFLPLLPAVAAANRAAGPEASETPAARWRGRNTAVTLLGLPLVAIALASALGLIPSNQVVPGSDVRESDIAWLSEAGLLAADEELVYFYTPRVFSAAGEGILLTDRRVVSYWTDPMDGQLVEASAEFSEIVEVESKRSSWGLGATIIRVYLSDEDWFMFSLPAEGDGDLRFLEELDRNLADPQPAEATA